jgi:hypothetical protein
MYGFSFCLIGAFNSTCTNTVQWKIPNSKNPKTQTNSNFQIPKTQNTGKFKIRELKIRKYFEFLFF